MPEDKGAWPDLAAPTPWPDAPPPAGHNQPPLEDQIVLEFESDLHSRGLDKRAADVTQAASSLREIENETLAGQAGDLIAAARAAKAGIEAARETQNRPLLTATRALKAKADGIVAPMDSAVGALRGRLDAFMASAAAPVHGDYGALVGVKTEWRFEIVDLAKVPLPYRRHPSVIEAIEKVIGAQVRGGARKINGVRIWSETKANVR